jgi:hypothetical protein
VTLDRRLHAFRPDLADKALEGKVEAERFRRARPAVIAVPVADLHKAPARMPGIDTQFLLGEQVRVFDVAKGWAWVQGERDSYVGYMPGSSLSFELDPAPTPPRDRLRSYRLSRAGTEKAAARLAVDGVARHHRSRGGVRRGTRYAMLPDGAALPAVHVAPVGDGRAGFCRRRRALPARALSVGRHVWLRRRLLRPRPACHGMAGRTVLRDTDMQEASIGEALETGGDYSSLRRGDLVFWKGHVGIMTTPITSARQRLHHVGRA